ncbi:MAG: hypothetical protein EPO07_02170 [Verrucomicrobia bacterium]|nr:MAG: hypothetical protein EPO07_02170 [Verrucomicrobiota bacterium]
MDFFERQDKARRNTKWLVFYFALAVLLITLSVYFVSLFAFGTFGSRRHFQGYESFALWNPKIFLFSAAGTLAVIACGSFYKMSELSSGGSAVAESMGGRLVPPNTTDPLERKLRNVVEEMALASGVPVPQVYVMDNERGINAFAAGHSPSDAAVAVTRGCMETLTRDELQGVIGHEFSHILNGDMRLNLRLMGIIFGIMCLAIVGRTLLRVRSSGRDRNPLPLLGLLLLVLGWVGVFFGNLIQAAVSRQREFLADASAVQFTRNPLGLSGALQKIGGSASGSEMISEHAAAASHMFFSSALSSSFFNLFATHPPLEQRIQAIDPTWDGKFKRVEIPREDADALVESILGKPRGARMAEGLAAGLAGAAAAPRPTVRAQTSVVNIGAPTPMHLRYAVELRSSLPESVRAATREPLNAVALVYAMLLSEDAAMRATQIEGLAQRTTNDVAQKALALWPEVVPLASRARLPLVELALPALRGLRPNEYEEFTRALKWLIESDEQIELFEFVLQKIVSRHLASQFRKTPPPIIQFYTVRPLVPDCAVLLSALAQSGSADDAEVAKAFEKGAPFLRGGEVMISLSSRSECGLQQIDAALNRLAQAAPQIKKNLIEACVQTVGADGVIQESEAELLRAICDTLDCPMPPVLVES